MSALKSGLLATYPDLLNSTHLPTLSDRRKVAKLCHLYKIVHGLTDCQSVPVSQKPITYSRRRNPIQLQQPSTRSTQFHFSFYPHTISIWNNLCLNNDSLLALNTFKHSITQLFTLFIILLLLYSWLCACISSLLFTLTSCCIFGIRNYHREKKKYMRAGGWL